MFLEARDTATIKNILEILLHVLKLRFSSAYRTDLTLLRRIIADPIKCCYVLANVMKVIVSLLMLSIPEKEIDHLCLNKMPV